MVKYYPDLKVSNSDQNKYKAFKLDNDLMVYLIHNPDAEKAAGALACHVGSLRDPNEFQGLAHFLEHMLFIGSEKYPSEGEYMTFLGQNGGYSNAYTSHYITNYHFEIKDDKLLEALDRFAQFFISPLFMDQSVFKEINAVNSEAEMYYNNDQWRMVGLDSLLCDQKALLSKYNVGNLDTLGDLRGHIPLQSDQPDDGDDDEEEVQGETDEGKETEKVEEAEEEAEEPVEEKEIDPEALKRKNKLVQSLKDFHKKHYSANQMALCVYTKGDLDKLEEEVIRIFSGIENKQIPHESLKNELPPFPAENLNKFIKVVPVNKGYNLKMVFRLKQFDADKNFKSGDFISHLIGHESKGSALDLLSEEGLALEVGTGFSRYEDYMSDFQIDIRLTKKGAAKENIPKIISAIGAYINMLRKEGPKDWIYEELKTQSDINFDYQDTYGGITKCTELVETFLDFKDPERVLYNPSEYRQLQKQTTTEILDSLTEENLHIFYISDELQATDEYETDPIYKTRYHKEAIRPELVKAFREGDVSWSKLEEKIHLPPKNVLLPKNFELKKVIEEFKVPQKIEEKEDSSLWHWQDHKFKLPKTIAMAQIYVDPGRNLQSVKCSQMIYIWNTMLTDNLRSMSYLAQMAKIDSSINYTRNGFSIFLSSFNESVRPFFAKLIENLKEFHEKQFTEEKFESYRHKCEIDLLQQRNDSPYSFVFKSIKDYIQNHHFPNAEMVEATRAITYDEIVRFSKHIFDTIRFEWLIEGNLTGEEAKDICADTEKSFKAIYNSKVLPKDQVAQNRIVKLQADRVPIVELDSMMAADKNSSFVQIFQMNNSDCYSPHINFLHNWLETPYFEDLRTQQQLGYAVFAVNHNLHGVRHFMFCIQSDVKSTHHCINRTKVFIEKAYKELKDMPSDKFEELRSGTLSIYREPNRTLGEQFGIDWQEIKHHIYRFDRKEWLCQVIEKLTKEDVLEVFEKLFIRDPRTFEIHLYSQATKEESIAHRKERQEKQSHIQVFPSAQAFKNSSEFYVDAYSQL